MSSNISVRFAGFTIIVLLYGLASGEESITTTAVAVTTNSITYKVATEQNSSDGAITDSASMLSEAQDQVTTSTDPTTTAQNPGVDFSFGHDEKLSDILDSIDDLGSKSTTQSLPENVKYREIKIGGDAEATTTTTREIHFTMWLESGKSIRSSRTEMYPLPIKFTPGQAQVIRGIEIGTEGMRVGGRRLIIIPPASGYGKDGAHDVPPDATLFYDVELISAI